MTVPEDTAAHDLATLLDQARAAARPAPDAHRPVTVADGQRTAELLYEGLRARGARQIGWKLGATDANGQQRLGTDRPFLAPVYDAMSAPLGAPVSRGRFVAPLLEVEIGVDFTGPTPTLRPCVEIADSRYAGWASSLPETIADHGLQGLMLLGPPVAPLHALTATVTWDGEVLATGTRSFAEALALAALVERPNGMIVATGTLTPPVPLTVGYWRIDLDQLGRFAFEVTP